MTRKKGIPRMNANTGFTFQSAMGEITRGVIETVAERPGDSETRRALRHQTTAWSMESFMARDPVETMLAGHCVIFHHMLHDYARDMLRGQPEEIKLRAYSSIHGSGKMFLAHLSKFEQLQTRAMEKLAGQPPVQDTPAAESILTRGSVSPRAAAPKAPAAPSQADVRTDPPSGAAIEAPETRPEEMRPGPAAETVPIESIAGVQTAAPRYTPAEQPASVASAAPPAAQTASTSVSMSVVRTAGQRSSPAAQPVPVAVAGPAVHIAAPQSAPAVQPVPTVEAVPQSAAAPPAAQPPANPIQRSAMQPNGATTPGRADAETPPRRAMSDPNPLSQAEFERELLLSQRDRVPRTG